VVYIIKNKYIFMGVYVDTMASLKAHAYVSFLLEIYNNLYRYV